MHTYHIDAIVAQAMSTSRSAARRLRAGGAVRLEVPGHGVVKVLDPTLEIDGPPTPLCVGLCVGKEAFWLLL